MCLLPGVLVRLFVAVKKASAFAAGWGGLALGRLARERLRCSGPL